MTETDPASEPKLLPHQVEPPKPELDEPVRPGPAPRSGGRSAIVPVLLVLLCVGLAGGGYFLWQQHIRRDALLLELSQQVEQNRVQLGQVQQSTREQLERQLAQAQTQLSEDARAIRAEIAGLRQTQEQLQQRVDGQQQRLSALATTSREDWLLAEAEYLLKIANQRILLERTTANAVALLRSADDLIQQAAAGTGDAELFAVRKALSRDLAALEKIAPVDKEGIYLRLYALAESLNDLPRVRAADFAAPEATTAAVEVAPDAGWAARLWAELKGMLGTFNDYIRIDDVDAPAKPLVDSYFTQLAGLNVRLLLEQAQLAVLQQDPAIYQHSLQQAQTLLQDYYLASEEARQLRDKLAELATVEIAPVLPDISASLGLLHDYLRQLHQNRPAPRGQLSDRGEP